MPTAALRPCNYPGCSMLVTGGYCQQHAREKPQSDYDARRGSASARGYGRAWQRLRETILAQEPLCRACKAQGLTVPAADVDHIIPRRDGGTDDASNLQPLCHACHSVKTARGG